MARDAELQQLFSTRFRVHLTESVYKVVWLKSIPAQIRQLILDYYLNKEQVDEFVRELTFDKRPYRHFL